MAKTAKRTKIETSAMQIVTQDDADIALKNLAILKSQIETDEAAYNAEEHKQRALLTAKHIPLHEEIVKIEKGLQMFGELNRHLFEKKRTIELKHGSIGFRTHPPKVSAIKGITIKAIVEMLKNSRYAERFIATKLELNKEAIIASRADNSIEAPELRQFGLEVIQSETFGYELKFAIQGDK